MHHFNGGRGNGLGQTVTILAKQWFNWPEKETMKPLNESTKLHFTGVSSNEASIYLFSRLQRTTASRDPLREQALSSMCATQEQMFFAFFFLKLLILYSKGSFPQVIRIIWNASENVDPWASLCWLSESKVKTSALNKHIRWFLPHCSLGSITLGVFATVHSYVHSFIHSFKQHM